jgi:hypothetical protein
MIDYTKNIEPRVSTHGIEAEKKGFFEKTFSKDKTLDLYSKICGQLLTLGEMNKILLQMMSGKYKGGKTVDEIARLIVNSVSAGNSDDYSYYSILVSDVFTKISQNETSEDSIVKTKAYVLTVFVSKWSTKNTSFCKIYSEKMKKEGKETMMSRPKTVSSGVSKQKTTSSVKPEVSTEFPKNLPKEIPFDMGALQGLFDSPVAPATLRRFESMSTLGSMGNNVSDSPRESTGSGGSRKPKKNIQKKKPSAKKQKVKTKSKNKK